MNGKILVIAAIGNLQGNEEVKPVIFCFLLSKKTLKYSLIYRRVNQKLKKTTVLNSILRPC